MAVKSPKSKNLFPAIALILGLIVLAELACQGLNFYDGWKRYNELLTKTVSYRGQAYSISKPKDVSRILLLGGSAVHDTVQDYRESWPYLLEQKLRAETGKKMELINMGFYSEASTDEAFKLHEFGLALKPDLVIVFDGENDVFNLFRHFDYHKRLYEVKSKNILHEKKHDFFTRVSKGIRKNSALYQRINLMKKNATVYLTDKLAPKAPEPAKTYAPAKEAPAENAFAGVGSGPSEEIFFEDRSRWPEITAFYKESYGGNLETIARLLQKNRIKGLFIFQPDLSYKTSPSEAEKAAYARIIGKYADTWAEIQKQTYPEGIRLMLAVSEKYRIPVYDFNKGFLAQGDMHDSFDGNVHFTAKGRELVAEEVARIVLNNKLI